MNTILRTFERVVLAEIVVVLSWAVVATGLAQFIGPYARSEWIEPVVWLMGIVAIGEVCTGGRPHRRPKGPRNWLELLKSIARSTGATSVAVLSVMAIAFLAKPRVYEDPFFLQFCAALVLISLGYDIVAGVWRETRKPRQSAPTSPGST